jgi:LysM repeat protein
VIGGLLVLWWTRPSARAVVRSEPAATGTITPDYSAIIPSLPTQEPESIARVAADTATPPPPAASAAPTPIQHKVASGESLGLIAEKYGIKVKDLMAANNLSGDFLRIGDVLTIPGSAAPQAPTLTPSPTGGTLIYKVSAGDTISDLA